MNVPLIVAIIIGIGLIGMAFVLRRPRTAEDMLGQPAPQPVASGANSDLRNLIELNVLARSTGLLTARSSSGDTCSVAFLFGRVFHAACGSVEGEDAVRMALAWTSPLLNFDAKAQLPVKETIIRPIASILDAA